MRGGERLEGTTKAEERQRCGYTDGGSFLLITTTVTSTEIRNYWEACGTGAVTYKHW